MKFNTEYYQLGNGVRVLEIPMAVESVAVLVMVRTGSRNEERGQEGISHVLEHMLFKGTEKYKSPLELAGQVDRIGGEFNAFTGKEYTGYYIKSARNHIRTSMDVLSQMLLKPLLDAEALEREKGVIVEEINMYEDLPMEKAGEEFENLLFKGTDLGREVIGYAKSVRSVSTGNLREYMGKWYRGENVLVVVAGKLDGKVREMLEEYFGGFGEGKMDEYMSKAKVGKDRVEVLRKDTEQAHFVTGLPTVDIRDERRFPLSVLRVVLGGNMSSRLFTEIREKRGWAYYVRAGMDTYSDQGYMGVSAGVKLDVLAQAIEVVREEITKIGSDITSQEVKDAKEFLKGKLALSLEEPMDVARFFAQRALIIDEVVEPDKVLAKIESVDLEQVRQMASEFFREEALRTVVVGPYNKEMQLSKSK